MIIGVDVGNYSLKTTSKITIKSLVNTQENILGSKIILEYDNQKFIIGEGTFESEINKSSKENFIPLLYTGIALSSQDKINQVVCGLPINQFARDREAVENLINNNKIKTIKINGDLREIIITDFKVYPEGVGAYYSLETNKDVIIVDIGGRTTDIAYICDKKHQISSTVNVGTLNIYNDVATKLNTYYGLSLDTQMAERIIERGYCKVDGVNVDINFITDILKTNFMKIKEELDFKYPARTEDIILVGGGAKLFGKAFRKRYINSSVAIDPIYANANGFKKVGDMLWK